MPSMMRVPALMLALALVPLTGVGAQGATPLAPGMTVRYQLDSPPTVKGTVVSTSNAELVYETSNGTATDSVKFRDITRLDVYQGRHTRLLHGMALGGFAGAAAGLIIGGATNARKAPTGNETVGDSLGCSVANPNCTPYGPDNNVHNGQAEASFRGAVIGLLGGAVIGGIWGGTHQFDIWRHVPYHEYQVYLSVAPAMGKGVVIRVSMRR
ncbi:MAG TPA: hypothetical protein VF722_07560 [Gemmatimonadaceae bacterium]